MKQQDERDWIFVREHFLYFAEYLARMNVEKWNRKFRVFEFLRRDGFARIGEGFIVLEPA